VGLRPTFYFGLNPAMPRNGHGRLACDADLPHRIERLIAPAVRERGFDIVRVLVLGENRPRVQIMAERHGGGSITVDDCADISRAVSAALIVDDPIDGSYTLEVSSPGIDRPLTRPEDFERFAGREAKLTTAREIDGRKRFRGRLLGLDGGAVRIVVDGIERAIVIDDIAQAKLVLTDALLREEREQ
jgi:ribosome maturation factor RimP